MLNEPVFIEKSSIINSMLGLINAFLRALLKTFCYVVI